MGQAPSSVLQIALLVLFVLPGLTYQFLRERWRGPVPGEQSLGQRMVRAVFASILLDAVYALAAGPQLLRLARGEGHSGWTVLAERPRVAALVALLLFVVVPAVAACAVSWWERRKLRSRYSVTATAWEHMFRDRARCYVRVRLRDGSWAGGRYGHGSYATSYPQPAELYLEESWRMAPDGSFVAPVVNSGGLYVRSADIDLLELVREQLPPDAPPVPGVGRGS
ncbi:DUF6338 family protein [Streptomyces atriruber]|uniref:DUF6338 family protein n=1 Tax=Streptomyces atriruber TaxID=545121 RepID=UPI0006E3FFF1|nr:DUF6338 family protein [Streptomyces atriruber]